MSEADHTSRTSPTDRAAHRDTASRVDRDRQLDDVLGAIGQQARERNLSRAETVAAVLEEFPAVSPERIDSATQAAHKLAGSAGTFGMDQASRLARGLEQFLVAAAGDPTRAVDGELTRVRTDVAELQRLLAPQ